MILPTLLLFNTALTASGSENRAVVKDMVNHIYWQDAASGKKSTMDWDDAVAYCDDLKLNGMTNWRLPNFNELLTITDYSRSHPAINSLFEYVKEETYWTSQDFAATKARAWTIHFGTGKTYYNYKTTNHAVRCVKEMKKKDNK